MKNSTIEGKQSRRQCCERGRAQRSPTSSSRKPMIAVHANRINRDERKELATPSSLHDFYFTLAQCPKLVMQQCVYPSSANNKRDWPASETQSRFVQKSTGKRQMCVCTYVCIAPLLTGLTSFTINTRMCC